jgi:outer membrane immunogenic protein
MMKTLASLCLAAAAIGMSAPAGAADMPLKAAPIAVAPAVNWTSCYIGANAGGGSSHNHYIDPLAVPPLDLASHEGSGGLAGGQVGCDVQYGTWVFGVQGMWDWTGIKGEHLKEDIFTTTISSLGTATGRIGFTALPNTLLYVKGGAAWVRDRETKVDGVTFLPEGIARYSRSGWTAGAGLEVMTQSNFSFFLEYNYLGFGTHRARFTNLEIPPIPATFPLDIKQSVWTVTVGVNYRLNWAGPIVARY